MEWIIGWGLIWLLLAWAGWRISVLVFGAIGAAIAEEAGAAIGAAVGWIVGGAWWVFSIIQVIIHVVHLIEYFS